VLGAASGRVAPVSEARLKPNDLTLPDIGHHPLIGVPTCHDVNHRQPTECSGAGSPLVGLITPGSEVQIPPPLPRRPLHSRVPGVSGSRSSRSTRPPSHRRIPVSASRGRFPDSPPWMIHLSGEPPIVPWGDDGSGVAPYRRFRTNQSVRREYVTTEEDLTGLLTSPVRSSTQGEKRCQRRRQFRKRR